MIFEIEINDEFYETLMEYQIGPEDVMNAQLTKEMLEILHKEIFFDEDFNCYRFVDMYFDLYGKVYFDSDVVVKYKENIETWELSEWSNNEFSIDFPHLCLNIKKNSRKRKDIKKKQKTRNKLKRILAATIKLNILMLKDRLSAFDCDFCASLQISEWTDSLTVKYWSKRVSYAPDKYPGEEDICVRGYGEPQLLISSKTSI